MMETVGAGFCCIDRLHAWILNVLRLYTEKLNMQELTITGGTVMLDPLRQEIQSRKPGGMFNTGRTKDVS